MEARTITANINGAMKQDQIISELREFIQQQFGVPEADPEFTNEVNLFDFGYIDSLGAVDLMGFIEQRFGARFTDSDWVNYSLNSIQDMAGFVVQRRGGGH